MNEKLQLPAEASPQQGVAHLDSMGEIAALGRGGTGGLLGRGQADVVRVRPQPDLDGNSDEHAEKQRCQRGFECGLGWLPTIGQRQWKDGRRVLTWSAAAVTIGLNSV